MGWTAATAAATAPVFRIFRLVSSTMASSSVSGTGMAEAYTCGKRFRSSHPCLAFHVPSESLRVFVVRCAHAADAGIGSMDAVRAVLCAGAGTGRHEQRGPAVHHPHERT